MQVHMIVKRSEWVDLGVEMETVTVKFKGHKPDYTAIICVFECGRQEEIKNTPH